MPVVLGISHRLYYQSTGTREAWPAAGIPPNLTEIKNVRSLTFNGDADKVDVTAFGAGSLRQFRTTLINVDITFDMIRDTSDSAFQFLYSAWLAGTIFGLAVLDSAPVQETQGFWLDAVVEDLDWDQKLEDGGKASLTIRNGRSDVPLEYVAGVIEGFQWDNPYAGPAFMALTVTSAWPYIYNPDVAGELPQEKVGTGGPQSVGFDYTGLSAASRPYIVVIHGKLLSIDNTSTADPIFEAFPDLSLFNLLHTFKLDNGFASSARYPVTLPSTLAANPVLNIFEVKNDIFNAQNFFPDFTSNSNLQTFHVDRLTSYADMQFPGSVPASLEELVILGYSTSERSTLFTGTLPTLSSTSLVTLRITDTGISGAIPALPSSIESVQLSNNSLSGSIPNLASLSSLSTFDVGQNSGLNGWQSATLPTSLTDLDVADTSLPQATVDGILDKLDNAGATGGTVDVRNTYICTKDGFDSRDNLEGKGWTVLLDEGIQWWHCNHARGFLQIAVSNGVPWTFDADFPYQLINNPDWDEMADIGIPIQDGYGTDALQSIGFPYDNYVIMYPDAEFYPRVLVDNNALLAIDNTVSTDWNFHEVPDISPFPNFKSLKLEGWSCFPQVNPVQVPTDLTANTPLENYELKGRTLEGSAFPNISGLNSLETLILWNLRAINWTFPSSLPNSINSIILSGFGVTITEITGPIPDLSNTAMAKLEISDMDISGWSSSSVPSSLVHVDLNDTFMSQFDIDDVLTQLDSAGANNGYCDLRGTTTPSSTGLTAKSNLQGKGWTVYTD